MSNNHLSTNSLNLLQLNVCGLKANFPLLSLALAEERYDIVILQETLLKTGINIKNYTGYHNYYQPGLNRGTSILVRSDIQSSPIDLQMDCGRGVEHQGVSISLQDRDFNIFNIYRPPHDTAKLKIDHIFAIVNDSHSILCGDFNAHNPIWNNPSNSSANKICTTGRYLEHLLQDFSEVSLVNPNGSTHNKGGVLDLIFVSAPLLPITRYSMHPYLASDHFALTTIIEIPRIQSPPSFLKWNFKKANWKLFQENMENWANNYTPSDNLEQIESDVVNGLHEAANHGIPQITSKFTSHTNFWYYNSRVKELKHRLLILRKKIKNPTQEILKSYRDACKLIRTEIQEIKTRG